MPLEVTRIGNVIPFLFAVSDYASPLVAVDLLPCNQSAFGQSSLRPVYPRCKINLCHFRILLFRLYLPFPILYFPFSISPSPIPPHLFCLSLSISYPSLPMFFLCHSYALLMIFLCYSYVIPKSLLRYLVNKDLIIT